MSGFSNYKTFLISIVAVFFLVMFAGCAQHIKTEVVHYPEYWSKMGYGTSKNITMKIIPADDSNDAKKKVNVALVYALNEYMKQQQTTLKLVDARKPANMRLILAISKCDTKNDSKEYYEDEIVYKTDEYGFPLTDSNGDKIPVWKTDKYGRHLYDDEGRPLLKTKRNYYTIIYNEVGCSATAVLVNDRTKDVIDTFQSSRSYWSRGTNPDSQDALFIQVLAKIVEDFYSKFAPYTFVLDIKDKNIFRTAKQDLDNNGEYIWTTKFQSDEPSARILLKLPSTADNNEFEIAICEAGRSVNAADAKLYSVPLVWKGEDDQVNFDFSPAKLFSTTGGKKKYDFHLLQSGKSLMHETITIKPASDASEK